MDPAIDGLLHSPSALMSAMQPLYAVLGACFCGKDGEKALAALDRVHRTATDMNT